jgi:hypothetical protein
LATAWSAQVNQNFGSTEVAFRALEGTSTVVRAYYDGAGNIKSQKSTDEGLTWAAAVTVDATAGDNDVMLNEPLAYDQVTGRLHLLYGRNIDNAGAKAVLLHRFSDDQGATWSAEHVVDPGTGHTGLNSFFRVGIYARNSVVSIHFTYESASTFTTDGLWRSISTDGGATFSAVAKAYTGTVIGAYEPNVAGFADGTVLVSWYDDGVNNNQAGDLWLARSSDNGQTWSGAATKITTTTDYGRPRLATDNGVWWIAANKPWNSGSPNSDTYTLTSTDNGVTWGTPTLRIAHDTNNTSHPDVVVVDQFVGIITNMVSGGHKFVYSTDGGATFSSATNPLSDASTSDAPRLLATPNYVIAVGYDQVNGRSMWAFNPFFAVLPQSQVAQSDDFNRTENPLSQSGAWTQGSVIVGATGNALKANGSGATRQLAAGSFDRSGSYRNGATYTGNAEAWALISAIGGTADIGLGDPATKNGYYSQNQDTDFGSNSGLQKQTAGVTSTIGALVANANQAGDVVAIQVVGNYVVAWKVRGGVYIEIARVVDTSFRANLKASQDLAGNVGAGPTLDAYGAGSLSAPGSSSVPNISGAAQLGSLLVASRGGWTNSPTRYTYQWKRDGAAISGAVLPFYTVAAGDIGHTLTVTVTATNAVGSNAATSSGVSAATATFLPAIHGSYFF